MSRRVCIEEVFRDEDGFWLLKSEDVPGLLLAGRDRAALWSDLPAAIEMLSALNRLSE